MSYEGSPGNPRRAQLPYPAMWYLMVEGSRCPVLPYEPRLPEASLEAALSAWVEDNALGPVESSRVARIGPPRPTENWWGLS